MKYLAASASALKLSKKGFLIMFLLPKLLNKAFGIFNVLKKYIVLLRNGEELVFVGWLRQAKVCRIHAIQVNVKKEKECREERKKFRGINLVCAMVVFTDCVHVVFSR